MKRPYLSSLTHSTFTAFRDAYRADVARRADPEDIRPAFALISPSALRLVQRRIEGAATMDSEDLLIAIEQRFFSPRSEIAALRGLQGISFPPFSTDAPSVEMLLSHVTRFQDLLEGLAENTRPPRKLIRNTFIHSLPAILRTRVELHEPHDLDEAIDHTLDELDELLDLLSTLPQRPTSRGPLPRRDPTGPAPRTQPTQPGHQRPGSVKREPAPKGDPANCDGCGHPGHARANCPNKDRPGFFAHGKRRVPIRLERAKIVTHTNDRLPRRTAVLRPSREGPVTQVQVLMDTGATVDMVHPGLAEDLVDGGATVIDATVKLDTAGGTIEVDQAVVVYISIGKLSVTLPLFIHDCGEQVLLSYPTMQRYSLSIEEDPPIVEDDDTSPTRLDPATTDPGEPEEPYPPAIIAVQEEYASMFGDVPSKHGALVPAMSIELIEGAKPVAEPPRRQSPAVSEVLRAEVTRLLDLDIIEPSTSPWAAPAFTVPKKGGSRRMVIDYRALNPLVRDCRFPLANPEEILAHLSGKTHFATLDLVSGYHQVPLAESSRPISAFTTPDGLYQFKRVPFGVKTAPSYFQWIMRRVLDNLSGTICEVFIDDIVVHGTSPNDLADNLRAVLDRLYQHKFVIHPNKCCLCSH